MSTTAATAETTGTRQRGRQSSEALRVLVVDDEHAACRLLQRLVEKRGHQVLIAKDAEHAWRVIREERPRIVLSDWVMPGESGLDLCRRIRESELGHYVYVILVTAKDQGKERVEGLDAGADDFLSKPVDAAELRARLRAAERVLALEKRLERQNAELRSTNRELEEAQRIMDRDLQAAGRFQRSTLPGMPQCVGGVHFDARFLPSSHVAGDVFGILPLGPRLVGFHHLDVAGHGVQAALLSMSLERLLSMESAWIREGGKRDDEGRFPALGETAASLNRELLREHGDDLYFTMVQAVLDVPSGVLRWTQAGHPGPLLVPRSGPARYLGEGGFPIGLLPEAEYEEREEHLEPGDRLFIYSDGVTECETPSGGAFGEERLQALAEDGRDASLGSVLARLEKELRDWRGAGGAFEDDASILALEVIEKPSS